MTNFDKMTNEQGIEYCYKHKNRYVRDFYEEEGGDGERAFNCLITLLEEHTISAIELPSYGMDYS